MHLFSHDTIKWIFSGPNNHLSDFPTSLEMTYQHHLTEKCVPRLISHKTKHSFYSLQISMAISSVLDHEEFGEVSYYQSLLSSNNDNSVNLIDPSIKAARVSHTSPNQQKNHHMFQSNAMYVASPRKDSIWYYIPSIIHWMLTNAALEVYILLGTRKFGREFCNIM